MFEKEGEEAKLQVDGEKDEPVDKEMEESNEEVDSDLEETTTKEVDADGLPLDIMEGYDQENATDNILSSESLLTKAFKQNLSLETKEKEKKLRTTQDGIEIEEEDYDDFRLKPNDRVFLVANSEDEYSSIEVQVYDETEGNFFVHHEITVPTFPLCLSNIAPTGKTVNGNYVAIGSFSPIVEIWDLDVINVMEPVAALSVPAKGPEEELAVMSMDYTSLSGDEHLATGDSENMIHLWDLKQNSILRSFTHHKDKVQSIRFSPREANILLSGSFDRTIQVFDARDNRKSSTKYKLSADCEGAEWAKHDPFQVVSASEDGKVFLFDLRKPGQTLLSFVAHDQEHGVGDLALNNRGLLATCSRDETVKIWNMKENEAKLILDKEMKVGELFTVDFCLENDLLLATAGEKGEIALWNLSEENGIKEVFT
eukprot:snap_masked-scaffold_7-processed-gene-9.42-mRNA-1 protein AED:0.13 eAED:0.13 QI:0/-1/0/1/-1/1/1/0/425